MLPNNIKTDLIIIGGGFMGLSLAYQAALRGIRSIVLEPVGRRQPHYMTGLLAPRADYLPIDRDETIATAYECLKWQGLFSNVVKPKLYIMPFSPDTPYDFSLIRSLMEIYDKTTRFRFGESPRNSFRISSANLEQMEPNLKKGYFREAIGFSELTASPDTLLVGLINMAEATNFSSVINYSSLQYYFRGNLIKSVLAHCPNGEKILFTNRAGIKVINTAGPWMQDVAEPLGIHLPVEYRLGFQLSIPQKHCFNYSLITFGTDGLYTIISQYKDYVQVGPTNIASDGPADIENVHLRQLAKEYLIITLDNIVDPGFKLTDSEIRSGGLRVKLKLPFNPNSNRPFVLNTGFDNYHVIYPGKAVLALKTADEFLAKEFDGKKYFYCLDGRKKYRNTIKLYFLRLKSLTSLGSWFIRYLVKKYFS